MINGILVRFLKAGKKIVMISKISHFIGRSRTGGGEPRQTIELAPAEADPWCALGLVLSCSVVCCWSRLFLHTCVQHNSSAISQDKHTQKQTGIQVHLVDPMTPRSLSLNISIGHPFPLKGHPAPPGSCCRCERGSRCQRTTSQHLKQRDA
jgi:hypothetical protein